MGERVTVVDEEGHMQGCGTADLLAHTRVVGMRDGGLVIADHFTGIEHTLADVDTVVMTERRGDGGLYRALKGRMKELFMIGDCLTPRKVDSAVREALEVCRSL